MGKAGGRQKIVVGIDVGGTNVKLGLIDTAGQIVARDRLVTKDHGRGRARLIAGLVQATARLLDQAGVARGAVSGVGIGLPGLIDVEQGVVKVLPNIPGWKNVPLRRILEDRLGLRVRLENDVNLITLGEWRFGAGAGVNNLLCLTLGTGVGAGLILDGAMYRGEGFVAGELGHMPLNEEGPDCPCGGHGCLERYVGNATLQAQAAALFGRDDISLEEVSALARSGDARAREFWRQTGTRIGNGLTGVVNLLNPRLIVIGGGVANSHRFLFPAIRETIRARAMVVQGRMFKVVRAGLGNDAGIVGARVLVDGS